MQGLSFGVGNKGERDRGRVGEKIFPCSSQERDHRLPILRASSHPLWTSFIRGWWTLGNIYVFLHTAVEMVTQMLQTSARGVFKLMGTIIPLLPAFHPVSS